MLRNNDICIQVPLHIRVCYPEIRAAMFHRLVQIFNRTVVSYCTATFNEKPPGVALSRINSRISFPSRWHCWYTVAISTDHRAYIRLRQTGGLGPPSIWVRAALHPPRTANQSNKLPFILSASSDCCTCSCCNLRALTPTLLPPTSARTVPYRSFSLGTRRALIRKTDNARSPIDQRTDLFQSTPTTSTSRLSTG